MGLYKFVYKPIIPDFYLYKRSWEIGGTGTRKHDLDIHIFMGSISTHIIVA